MQRIVWREEGTGLRSMTRVARFSPPSLHVFRIGQTCARMLSQATGSELDPEEAACNLLHLRRGVSIYRSTAVFVYRKHQREATSACVYITPTRSGISRLSASYTLLSRRRRLAISIRSYVLSNMT
jgi:hypothetical protein